MRTFQLLLSYLGAALLGAAIGFFAGRAYLKYEIRSEVETAVAEVRSALAAVSPHPGMVAPAPPNVSSGAAISPPPLAASKPAGLTPITVALLSKGFQPRNIQAEEFDDYIVLRLLLKNTGSKNIRAFDGVLHFTDLLDNEIAAANLSINESVSAGGETTWKGQLKYNQFRDADQRLQAIAQQNLKIRFVLKKVLFADGVTKEYSDD
jgi:hypothetical protein